jgi:uncharacterized protein YfbU (UPF0304 family)
MKLTPVERWMLSNQFRILEALYPDEAESYAEAREAIENGYELQYDLLSQHISEDVMSVEDCNEVIDILNMFRVLKFSYEDLDDKSEIDEGDIEFGGFDGNHEGKQMAFTRHFCGSGESYAELNRSGGFNSHWPMLDRYRQMLAEWKKSANQHRLTKEDIQRIISE